MLEPEQSEIKNFLQRDEFAKSKIAVASNLRWLQFFEKPEMADELAWLKLLVASNFSEDVEGINDPEASLPCGLKVFHLDNPRDFVLNLEKRNSNKMYVRNFFDSLYNTVTSLLQKKKRIVLTGNAGIGKSWFQVYFLHRLLNEGEKPFRFVVRHHQMSFCLIDILTCRAWEITGHSDKLTELLSDLKKTLYLYEPGVMADQPPLMTFAPSLSTLSPHPSQIKEYAKQMRAEFLYMPLWDLTEVMAIAKLEGRNLCETEDNFARFGGIIRYTLGDSSVTKRAFEWLNMHCRSARKEVFRSIAAHIDDSANPREQYNISSFLVCYTDIPREGDEAFATRSLGMTSEYACKEIQNLFNKEDYKTRLEAFLGHLENQSMDVTGIDLESSVVWMLAVGPKTVKWYYCSVDPRDPSPSGELRHTKREIQRTSVVNTSSLNYPTDRTFGLVDCFMFIKETLCLFQITWQRAYPFRLRTLLAFREKLGVGIQATVNIYFISPFHRNLYLQRDKVTFLVDGECPEADIVDHNGKVLLEAAKVFQMWENTRVYVAFPENDDWRDAVKKCLASLQSAKVPPRGSA